MAHRQAHSTKALSTCSRGFLSSSTGGNHTGSGSITGLMVISRCQDSAVWGYRGLCMDMRSGFNPNQDRRPSIANPGLYSHATAPYTHGSMCGSSLWPRTTGTRAAPLLCG